MNKKQFNRVKSLYHDGVSMDVCFSSIMGMSQNHTEAAVFIRRFVQEMIEAPLYEEIDRKMKEIESWETLLQKETEEYEPSNGKRSSHVED